MEANIHIDSRSVNNYFKASIQSRKHETGTIWTSFEDEYGSRISIFHDAEQLGEIISHLERFQQHLSEQEQAKDINVKTKLSRGKD